MISSLLFHFPSPLPSLFASFLDIYYAGLFISWGKSLTCTLRHVMFCSQPLSLCEALFPQHGVFLHWLFNDDLFTCLHLPRRLLVLTLGLLDLAFYFLHNCSPVLIQALEKVAPPSHPTVLRLRIYMLICIKSLGDGSSSLMDIFLPFLGVSCDLLLQEVQLAWSSCHILLIGHSSLGLHKAEESVGNLARV